MIHIYHGEGKGKSTAAFGLAVRAAGADFNVIIAQFLKARDVGEVHTFSKIENITLIRANIDDTFSFRMTDSQKTKTLEEHNLLFKKAISMVNEKNTLIIFDEIIGAINEKLIDAEMVIDFLKNQPKNIEIVLTGRYPEENLSELADYITEMKKIKHPYDIGVKMRKGVEY